MLQVEFGDMGSYNGRNGHSILCGVEVHNLVSPFGGGMYLHVINLRGVSDACCMRIPHNYGDLVAAAILKEFVPDAAARVGLKPDTPSYMVIDKLLESENQDDKMLGQMMQLAFAYNPPPPQKRS